MYRGGAVVAVTAPASDQEKRRFQAACQRRRAELDREKIEALKVRRPFEQARIAALQLLEELPDEMKDWAQGSRCPVCKNPSGNAFEPRPASRGGWEQWSWWSRCASCSTEWGLLVCRECHQPFPVLQSAGEPREPPEAGVCSPAWMDHAHGRDLWAEPCWKPESANIFRCSHCGGCPGGGCLRCGAAGQGDDKVASEH